MGLCHLFRALVPSMSRENFNQEARLPVESRVPYRRLKENCWRNSRISCHLLCLTFLVPLNFFFAEYIKLLSYMSHMYSRPFSLRWFECTLPIEICGQQLWEYWYLMIFILVYCSKSSSGSRSRSHRSSNVVGQFFCFWMVLYGIHLRQNETPHRVGNRTESRCIIYYSPILFVALFIHLFIYFCIMYSRFLYWSLFSYFCILFV